MRSPLRHRLKSVIVAAALGFATLPAVPAHAAPDASNPADRASFAFTVAGDMRQFADGSRVGKHYFDGVCDAMKRVGPGAFLISPGDFDPPAPVQAVIERTFGRDYPWYVVVGNHEVETGADVAWVKHWAAGGIPHLVRKGPPGLEYAMYSFDYANSHFVAIDTYPQPKEGNKGPVDMTDHMFEWLEQDLAGNRQPLVWVIGHQPIAAQPDMDTHRLRHDRDSVSANSAHTQRFIALLQKFQVRAYLCGHTHDVSVVRLPSGLWQADSGHARGSGDVGAPSSFLKIRVEGEKAWVDVYRATDATAREYALRTTVELTK